MPKSAQYRLTWIPEHGIYALHEAANHESTLPFAPGSPQWFSWLSSIPSFTFTGKLGSITVRHEARGGAGTYWYAYRRQGDKMRKRYLGRTADLTLEHLEEVALHLTAPSVFSPKQGRSAEGPLQESVQVQGGNQTLTPKAGRPTHKGASLSSGSSPAMRSASQTGTAPRALHKAPDLLLATKLCPPRAREQLVSRESLVERLQQAVGGALTLVSAPAGYGKTTLLVQWQASTSTPVVWLSLEPEDNEPTQFLAYLLAALQTLDSHLGVRVQARLRLLQSADLEIVLALLINDLINWQGEDFALVLDDYHVITALPIHRVLTHLVEHLPPQVHLIIATQSDPHCLWRACGHVDT